jgi:hypothetical protein
MTASIKAAGGGTGSGRARGKHRGGGGRGKGVFVGVFAGADFGARFARQIAVLALPRVIGVHQDGADEAHVRRFVGDDADDIGASFPLLSPRFRAQAQAEQ